MKKRKKVSTHSCTHTQIVFTLVQYIVKLIVPIKTKEQWRPVPKCYRIVTDFVWGRYFRRCHVVNFCNRNPSFSRPKLNVETVSYRHLEPGQGTGKVYRRKSNKFLTLLWADCPDDAPNSIVRIL